MRNSLWTININNFQLKIKSDNYTVNGTLYKDGNIFKSKSIDRIDFTGDKRKDSIKELLLSFSHTSDEVKNYIKNRFHELIKFVDSIIE